jgi:hypothetical protein
MIVTNKNRFFVLSQKTGDFMSATKKQATILFQPIDKWRMLIVPFTIFLLISLSSCSRMTDLVVQKKSMSEQPSGSTQDLFNDVSALASTQGNEILNSSFAVSVANGINFSAGNYRLDNVGRLAMDFCFDQVDTGDWTIWSSHITDKKGLNATPSEGDLLEIRFPPILIDGKPKQQIIDFRGETSNEIKDYYIDADPNQRVGQRCVAMTYNLPPKFDLSSFTVIVDNILAYPDENTQCSEAAILNIQKILDERQTGIKVELKTDFSDGGGGMCGVEVVQKPEHMSLDEAMSIVSGNEMIIDLYGIRGPWVFEGSLK